MRVKYWGARGSYPVPAAGMVRYGGHTSCVELTTDDERRPLVCDAGTGLPELGRALLAGPCGSGKGIVRIFLSHLHWDHVLGLPLFAPAHLGGNKIVIYGRERISARLRDAVLGSMRPELFPFRIDRTPATIEFVELRPGESVDVDGARVTALRLNHPFGSLGYRFDHGGKSVAYVTDTSPFSDILYPEHYVEKAPEALSDKDRAELAGMRTALVEGLRGVDAAIYDTQYTPDEYAKTPHYGHGTPAHALEILGEAAAGKLIMFHHAPGRTDEAMDTLLAETRELGRPRGIAVDAARQGEVTDL